MLTSNNSGALTGSTLNSENKMKVKMIRQALINGEVKKVGDEVELPNIAARELVATNKAELVVEKAAEKKEEVAVKPEVKSKRKK